MKVVTPLDTQNPLHLTFNDKPVQYVPGYIFFYYPVIIVWALLLFASINRSAWNPQSIAIISVSASVYGLVLLYSRNDRSLNFAVVYGSYLTLSLLGITIVDIFLPGGLSPFTMRVGSPLLAWYRIETWPYAVIIAGLGITSFVLGSGVLGLFNRKNITGSGKKTLKGFDDYGNQGILTLGVLLLSLSAIYLIVMILTGRYALNTAYGDLHNTLGELPGYSFFLFGYATSITFIIATGNKQQIFRWGVVYGLLSTILLATGNRGEIFYAAAASIAIASYRGLKLNRKIATILIIVFFLLIPFIRQTRNIPITERQFSDFTFDWSEPFIELGFQLRVLVTTIDWIDGGEPHANGGTYWLPIQRIMGRFIPFVERPELDGNRFFISPRLPTQGYSVVAEAYFNFGVAGVVIIMGGLGAYLNQVTVTLSNKWLAFHGAILAILINNIRNGFIFVPGQIIYVVVLIIVAELFTKGDYEPHTDA